MRFTEINLFGVYVAPISLMMVAAWMVTIGLRRFAARFGLLRYVWHPSLFVFAVYMIVLSSMVMLVAARGIRHVGCRNQSEAGSGGSRSRSRLVARAHTSRGTQAAPA